VKEVAAMLKAIHAQEDKEAARKKAADVVEKLKAMKLAKASELVKEDIEETLQYRDFPREHWRSLRTDNPLERINAGDPPQDTSGGSIPRWQQCLDAGGLPVETRGGNKVGQQTLPGHGSAQRESCDGGFQGGLTNFPFIPRGRGTTKEEPFTPQPPKPKCEKFWTLPPNHNQTTPPP
jgi:hypothetical protein